MDAALFRAVNRFAARTTWLHAIAIQYAKRGIVVFAVLLVLGWWFARRDGDLPATARTLGVAAAVPVALGAAQLIGHAVDRARPYSALPHVHVLIGRTADFSFPSDHATAASAVAVGLLLVRRPLGVAALVLAAAMAFARVYVGAHYPGDVLAGLVVGGMSALAVSAAATRLLAPLLGRLRDTPLRPLIGTD